MMALPAFARVDVREAPERPEQDAVNRPRDGLGLLGTPLAEVVLVQERLLVVGHRVEAHRVSQVALKHLSRRTGGVGEPGPGAAVNGVDLGDVGALPHVTLVLLDLVHLDGRLHDALVLSGTRGVHDGWVHQRYEVLGYLRQWGGLQP